MVGEQHLSKPLAGSITANLGSGAKGVKDGHFFLSCIKMLICFLKKLTR